MENVQDYSVAAKVISIIICIGLFWLAVFYDKIGEWTKRGFKFLGVKKHVSNTTQQTAQQPAAKPPTKSSSTKTM